MADITARSNPNLFIDPNIADFAASVTSFIKEFFGVSSRDQEMRDIKNLLILEDWALDDMGLSRADVHNALDAHGAQSPKAYLSARRSFNMRRM